MSMIEQVVAALRAFAEVQPRMTYEEIARAAIEAMRDATDAMVVAGAEHVDPTNPYSDDVAGNVWSVMITAALGDQP